MYSDNPQDNSEQPNQTSPDPPQETPSYSDNPEKYTFVTPKPANTCLDKKANCCPNSGLCFFNGCVITCAEMKNKAHIQGNPDSSKETFSASVTDPSDKPTHVANMNTFNNLQITNITENEPSDVANSDEFVFLLSSSAIQNTIMLLLDKFSPPKTNQVKTSDNDSAELDNSAYNPHIDSLGSPTADPVNIVTAESSHFSSTANTEDNNDIDQYHLTHYDSGSTVPKTKMDRYSVPNLDKVTPTVKPVKK